MMGKMVYKVKNVHATKPAEVQLPNGQTVKSITCTEDPKGDKCWVRVIEL